MIGCASAALFTDHYELTMAEAYRSEGLTGHAVFELFFRRLPPGRSYAVAAGLEDALAYLESFRFTGEEIDWLRTLGKFSAPFLEWLREVRFTGDVWAVPEGTVVFENEPMLQVAGPVVEGQLAETFLLNQFHVQTMIATKAARIVQAARGRGVVEFGARRAHGIDAGIKLARASWIAGAAGTSLMAAGMRYGIPSFGTMAHSYIQAHPDERGAFDAFGRLFPGTTVLVDTYDTLRGVEKVIELLRGDRPPPIGAIRLDSGDLAALAKGARRLLDEAGFPEVQIIASSDLDEFAIAKLLEKGAPIDAFGVGTRMAVSYDAPTLDVAYKLVEYEGVGRIKLATSKVVHPGRKQVFRTERDGRLAGDTVARHDEKLQGRPLLVQVMRRGERLPAGSERLQQVRERAMEELRRLPDELHRLDGTARYPVAISQRLRDDLEAARALLGASLRPPAE